MGAGNDRSCEGRPVDCPPAPIRIHDVPERSLLCSSEGLLDKSSGIAGRHVVVDVRPIPVDRRGHNR